MPEGNSNDLGEGLIRLSGGRALARALRPEGIDAVFGIAGGKIAPFLQAVEEEGLRYIGVRHEAAGVMMAAAHYAATGRMALAFAELGPGSANAVGGLASALNNRLPLLLITSNNSHGAAYPAKGGLMEIDSAAMLRPLTKWSAVVHDPKRLPELVRAAFRAALTGRPGPVHLELPQDVLEAQTVFPTGAFARAPATYRLTTLPSPHPDAVQAALALLRGAKRPLLIAGGGLARSGEYQPLRALAKRLSAAVTTTQSGIGMVASDDPDFFGHGGAIGGPAVLRALREADVVLALGMRVSSWFWRKGEWLGAPGQAIIQVESDPEALGQNTPLSLGILADAAATVRALAQACPGPGIADPAWVAGLAAEWRGYQAQLGADASGPVMHPAVLARALGAALPPDALVVYDGGHTSFWSNDLTPVLEPRTRFHEAGMAQLGFGLPYALSLAALHPGRPVVNITGDGSFGFTLQELDTARRYGLNVVNIVHNNASWGVIAAGQTRKGFRLGVDLEGTDYAAIARGFGGFGETVTTPEALAPALARAFAAQAPAVLDCRVSFMPHPMLRAMGEMFDV